MKITPLAILALMMISSCTETDGTETTYSNEYIEAEMTIETQDLSESFTGSLLLGDTLSQTIVIEQFGEQEGGGCAAAVVFAEEIQALASGDCQNMRPEYSPSVFDVAYTGRTIYTHHQAALKALSSVPEDYKCEVILKDGTRYKVSEFLENIVNDVNNVKSENYCPSRSIGNLLAANYLDDESNPVSKNRFLIELSETFQETTDDLFGSLRLSHFGYNTNKDDNEHESIPKQCLNDMVIMNELAKLFSGCSGYPSITRPLLDKIEFYISARDLDNETFQNGCSLLSKYDDREYFDIGSILKEALEETKDKCLTEVY